MRSVLRRLVIACFVVCLQAAGTASAGTIGVGLTFTSGKLSVSAAHPTVVPGAPVSVPVTVDDARGTGSGWTLKLAGSPSVSVVSITASCAAHSTCTLPVSAVAPSGATVLRVQKGTGMGVVKLAVTLSATARTAVTFAVS